jgi:hypothetical protein
MFEAINPMYWWGATAISVPIIIHLINRLRYRRIRWAAMEFLLKSQQRNRRKLILEQLLLLAARCALVLLFVAFVVRPTGCLDQAEARSADWPTYHVALLDDSLSMMDQEDPRNPESPTAFSTATRLLAELARKASEAPTAQYLTVLRYSAPEAPELGRPFEQLAGAAPGQQLTAEEVRKLKDRLDALRCTYAPVFVVPALRQAARYFENVREGHKVLHVLSDFRRSDWSEGAEAQEAAALLAQMAWQGKVEVRLHDVALPRRSANPSDRPEAHGNVGITDLAVRARIQREGQDAVAEERPTWLATPGKPLYVHATVKNFGEAERSDLRLHLRVDGKEREAKPIPRLAGGEQAVIVFDLVFSPEETFGLRQITVAVEDSQRQDHLQPDNLRYAYVDLRKEIPVLLVDPDIGVSEPPPASFYLMKALTGSARTGLRPERLAPRDFKGDEVVVLDPRGGRDTRRKIDQYPVIFLLNVSGVGEGTADLPPAGLKALEGYLRRGGSVVFFLGDRTNVLSFHRDLYASGQGIFPVPLMVRPDANRSESFVEDPPDETDPYPKVRLLRPDHPLFPFRGELRKLFTEYLTINRYFRVDPSWQQPEHVTVLLQLANRKPLSLYAEEARDLASRLDAAAPGPLQQHVRSYTDRIREWIEVPEARRAQKGPLIEAVGDLLRDETLAEFWSDPARQTLRQELDRFYRVLTSGDAVVFEAALGQGRTKGHVLAFLTPAAPTPIQNKDYSWNNWANELPFTFVPAMLALHDHLAALAQGAGAVDMLQEIGRACEVRLDAERYVPRLELWYQKEGDPDPVRLDTVLAREERGELAASLRPLQGPGHYRLRLNPPGTEGNPETAYLTAKGDPEEWPLAFNVNARAEGNLARLAEAELMENLAAGLQQGELRVALDQAWAFVRSRSWFARDPLTGTGEELSRSRSWSEYWWLLLVFLGLLLVEQYLAMRFSHHLQGGVASAPAQVQRSVRAGANRPREAEVLVRS